MTVVERRDLGVEQRLQVAYAMTWPDGRKTIDHLMRKGRLEKIDSTLAAASANTILGRATARLATARSGLESGDDAGAYSRIE